MQPVMTVIDVDPANVANPQLLKINVMPTVDANRLFIYTGNVNINPTGGVSPDDHSVSIRYHLNLSNLHNLKFDSHPFSLILVNGKVTAACTASLASIHGKTFNDDNSWTISVTDVDEENQDLILLVDTALQGTSASFNRFAYQVNVLVSERTG